MAEEKLNTGQGDQITMDEAVTPADPGPDKETPTAPEQDGPAQPEAGDVVVDAAQIDELMAEQRAAERAKIDEAEAAVPGEGAKEPETPTPGTEEKAPEATTPAADTRPESEKAPWERPLADLEAEQKPARRGRPAKSKEGPEAGKGDKAKKGRPAKDKTAPAKGKAPRDKVSQSKAGKTAPEQPAAKEGPAAPAKAEPAAPVVDEPAEPAPPPRPVEEQKIVYLKLSELHPFHTFREHPFKVVDDSPRMKELVSSIKAQGVFTPATVRPEKDGSGYEIIAGHCRMRGSELAGLEELPCIVRDMTDHEAVQEMKNSNKQRGDPLPSELARLLDLEVEDIKHQGGRLKGVAEGDIGKRSVEIVGAEHGMNYKKVMRYIRLNSLVPELLDMADAKRIGFMPAVELSFIKPKNQRYIAVSIEGEQSSPSVAQAKRMRELDRDGKLTPDIIDGILSEEKKEVDRVIITTDELNKYFGKEATPRQMKDQIMALLDEWKEKQPQELTKPAKSADKDR